VGSNPTPRTTKLKEEVGAVSDLAPTTSTHLEEEKIAVSGKKRIFSSFS